VRKSRYSDEQIAAALRQAEIGTSVADITRKLGISEATFYVCDGYPLNATKDMWNPRLGLERNPHAQVPVHRVANRRHP